MADCEQGKKLPEKATIGNFEFSFISTTTSAAKDIPKSAKNHVTLHSIDIHTTNGLTPLTIQSENKIVESSVVIEKTDTEEARLQFMNELENQMKDNSSSLIHSTKTIKPPSSFSDLLQYQQLPNEDQGGLAQINIHDGTTLQILNTLSKVPSSIRQTVLHYLKSVEEGSKYSLSKSC